MTDNELAGRIASLFIHLRTFTRSWVVYLVDPHLDNQPELRNKVFSLLYYGLFDSICDIEHRIKNLVGNAHINKNTTALAYIEELRFIFESVIHLLSCIDSKSSAFLKDQRNWLTHSYLNFPSFGKVNGDFAYFTITDRKIERKTISTLEYNHIVDELLANNKSVDDVLTELRKRFTLQKTAFWLVTSMESQWELWIQRDISENNGKKRVIFNFDGMKYFEFVDKHPNSLTNLRFHRSRNFIPPTVRDTVFDQTPLPGEDGSEDWKFARL